MKRILYHVFALAVASVTVSLQAREPLPYEATFEPENGFEPGSVDGLRGFTVVRGEVQVAPYEGVSGTAGLKLQPSRPFGIVQLSIDAGLGAADSPDKVVHTDFMIRPGAADPSEGDQFADVDGSVTGFFKIDDSGELHIFDGGDSGRWLPSGAQFELDAAGHARNWIRLSFRQDFERGLWDVAVNGRVFHADLAMADQSQSLEKIEFIGQSGRPLYVDNVRVSREATAFVDLDRDGMPDAWEAQQGFTEDDGRDGDKDGDGVTNIQELVSQTKIIEAMATGTDGPEMAESGELTALAQSTPTITVVENVAALETLVVADADTVMTLGYYTAHDGGSNLYRYNEESDVDCDGGFILDGPEIDPGDENSNAQAAMSATYTGTGQGRFEAVSKVRANARQFGAKGEEGVNDSPRFRAMIDSSLGAIEGISGDTYHCSSGAIIVNKPMILAGNGATWKLGERIRVESNDVVISNWRFVGDSFVETYSEGNDFENPLETLDSAIQLNGAAKVSIFDCSFTDAYISAHQTKQNKHINIERCRFDLIASAWNVRLPRFVHIRADGMVIKDCVFTGTNMYEFIKSSGYTNSGRLLIDSCEFYGSCQEDLLDAYTTQGPVILRNNVARLTGADHSIHDEDRHPDWHLSDAPQLITIKPSGTGNNDEISYPYFVELRGNDFEFESHDGLWICGSHTQDWSAANQSLIVTGNRLKITGAKSGVSAIDVKGWHQAVISDNVILMPDLVETSDSGEEEPPPLNLGGLPTMNAVKASGIQNLVISDNVFDRGSVRLQRETVPNPVNPPNLYGPTEAMTVVGNHFRDARGSAAVTIAGPHPDLDMSILGNQIEISHQITRKVGEDQDGEPIYAPIHTRFISLVSGKGENSDSELGSANTVRAVGNTGKLVDDAHGSLSIYAPTANHVIDTHNSWNSQVGHGSEIPTSGEHVKGDVVWNTSPEAGGAAGWVCVADGSPGIWKPFGILLGAGSGAEVALENPAFQGIQATMGTPGGVPVFESDPSSGSSKLGYVSGFSTVGEGAPDEENTPTIPPFYVDTSSDSFHWHDGEVWHEAESAVDAENHRTDTNNPHNVTAAQLSLGTSDDVEFGTAKAAAFESTSQTTQLQGDVQTSTGNTAANLNAIGIDAGKNNGGNHNAVFGSKAMKAGMTSNYNSVYGSWALSESTLGPHNAAFGYSSLRGVTSGERNVAIGSNAGRYIKAGTNNTTPDNSIYIGYDTRASAAANENEVVIGHEARGNGSDTTTLGNSSTKETHIMGSWVMDEQGSSPAGKDSKVILFAEKNASGKMKLMVQFPSGEAVKLLEEE